MQKISTLWPHLAPFWPRLAPFGQYGPCAHVFASCARVHARIFTKIFVWVFYYHISLSFKFHTDPSFCCGDIFSDTSISRYFKVHKLQNYKIRLKQFLSRAYMCYLKRYRSCFYVKQKMFCFSGLQVLSDVSPNFQYLVGN